MTLRLLHLLFLCLCTGFLEGQVVDDLRLDSCVHMASPGQTAFADVHVRVQEPARWNNTRTSLERFFDQFFSTYTQKKAGGRITLSLLVDTQGQACLYRVQPNSNVRPDYLELKRLLDATSWQPALLNGQPVKSTKVLYILFDGKRVNVQELE